jgi:Ca-activated chloride channel family protein
MSSALSVSLKGAHGGLPVTKEQMMKTKMTGFRGFGLGVAVVCLTLQQSFGAGLLKPLGSDVPARIRSHEVRVTINNGFARTEVDQVFANEGNADREMIYTFPMPKDSSLSELSLWVNGSELLGEVVEKERARRIYEEQVSQGRDTALAEKNDFKTFDISVGRVPAGGEARVRIGYYQPLEIDLNVGRYLYPLAEGGTDDDRIPFWSVDDQVSGPFRFELILCHFGGMVGGWFAALWIYNWPTISSSKSSVVTTPMTSA